MISKEQAIEYIGENWGTESIEYVIEAYCKLYVESGDSEHMLTANALMQGLILEAEFQLKQYEQS